MNKLPAKKRSELRAAAHKLTPVVIIGDKGLTDLVIAEIDRSLRAHELIKVRAATDDRDAREIWFDTICERLGAHPVQQIGKVFVVYRENPEVIEDRPRKPKPATREAIPEADKRRKRPPPRPAPEAPRPSTSTSRPRSRTPSPRPESEPRRRRPRSSR